MRKKALTTFAVLVLTLGSAASGRADDRVGFSEDFNTTDGWKLIDPFEKVSIEDGRIVFDTWVGSFMGAKPPEQPLVVGANADCEKVYDQTVDLDTYRYLVCKIDEKPMYSVLYFNDKQVQVTYTSGVIAQDLKPLGLTGKQKIKLHFEIMNNNRRLKIDYIRLVSRLSEEEKKGLIGPPVKLYRRKMPSHPWQKLDALYERAARPLRTVPEEKVYFRDVGTGSPIRKLTTTYSDEGFSERYRMWTDDGSAIQITRGGSRTYFFDKDQFVRGGIKNFDPPKYRVDFYKRRGWVQFYRLKDKTKKYELIYEFERTGKGRSATVAGDKLVGMDKDLVVVDASKTPPVVKRFPVPAVSAKGFGATYDGKWVQYFSPFGVYRKYCINLETGELREGAQFTFTHGMGGRPWSIMSYGSMAKLQVRQDANYPGENDPRDKLRVHGVYLDKVQTDYGAMTADGRYGYTNGTGGELAGQYVMFDREDAGTILRLCTYRVSKVTWDVWTKSIMSPDYTKMGYVSDILGHSDYYLCIVRQPDAPKALKAARTAAGVKLTWRVPTRHREIKGYNIYRSTKSGRDYARVNEDVVTKTEFVDTDAPATAYYLVAGQEHSGLEGYFSNEASARGEGKPVILHFEAEEGELTRPMRLMVDGDASGGYAVRVTPVAMGEAMGMLAVPVPVNDRAVWVRQREPGADWQWQRVVYASRPKSAPFKTVADTDGLAIDKIIITDDAGYKPTSADDRKPALDAPTGLKIVEARPNEIALAWDAHPALDLSHYSVYVGNTEDFKIGNETALSSTRKTAAVDWGIKPNTVYYYKVVAVDRRGQTSKPALIAAKTKPMDVVTVELPVEKAKLSRGLERGKARGINVPYVAHKKGKDEEKATFTFDVPTDGTYYLWMKYSPQDGRYRQIRLDLDGVEHGTFVGEQPTRMGRMTKPGRERWFVHRVLAGKGRYRRNPTDVAKLAAGAHTLAVAFDAKYAGKSPWISKLWVTNDASFVPEGYSPQVRFNRRRRQR